MAMCGRDRIFQILGTSFGLAYLPIAPGTWGSLPGVAIFILISVISPVSNHSFWIAAALIIVCVLCLSLSPWAERYWGVKDPRRFVLDEVAGFLVTVLLFRTPDPFLTAVWAFFFSRIMDILKLQPARYMERLPSGWGILLDDVVASLYAAALLHILARILPANWFGGWPVSILTF
jgi:phosphatidylglycerophosphatase A